MSAARYVQPVPFYPAPSRYSKPHSHMTLAALRKFAQGAGSALLVFAGADNFTGAAAAAPMEGSFSAIDFTSVEGLLQAVTAGPLTGPMHILAAALIFLAAGKCVARFLGLAVAALVLFLYMQGVTVEDGVGFFTRFGERLAAAAQAFQTAQVSY